MAERESVQVFKDNLRCLLLTPPVSGCNVLAIDPGFKHGCKIAVINKNGVATRFYEFPPEWCSSMFDICAFVGSILDTAVLDLTGRHTKDSENRLQGLLLTHKYDRRTFFLAIMAIF